MIVYAYVDEGVFCW